MLSITCVCDATSMLNQLLNIYKASTLHTKTEITSAVHVSDVQLQNLQCGLHTLFAFHSNLTAPYKGGSFLDHLNCFFYCSLLSKYSLATWKMSQ